MQNMKRLIQIFLCCCLVLSAGCSKEPETIVIGITATGQPEAASSAASTEGEAAASAQPAASGKAQAKVRDTVAYVLSCAEGPALYGAVAYENTGDTPLTLTQADFAFTLADHVEEVTFTPVFAKETVVLPGETAYAALWYTMADLVPGAQVALDASLSWEAAQAESRIPIQVENIHLAHNYPAFVSMAGTITAAQDCPCNIIYTAFYDQDDRLLGVWYFTDNAQLMGGEPKAFTTHMTDLPLTDLADTAARVEAFGVGIP